MESSDVLQDDIDDPDSSHLGNKAKNPCEPCRVGHRKCDALRPACGLCLQRGRQCEYRTAPPSSRSQLRKASSSLAVRSRPSSFHRISKACLPCRGKKKKCDGVMPECGPCKKSGLESNCEYDSGPGRRTLNHQERPRKRPRMSSQTKSYSVPGQREPSELAASLRKHSNTTPTDLTLHGSYSDSASATRESSNVDSERAFHTPESDQESSFRPTYLEPGSPGSDSSVEFLEDDSELKLNDTEGGQSDGPAFAAKIELAVRRRTDTSRPSSSMETRQNPRNLSDIGKNKSGLKRASPDAIHLVLPARKTADHLMATYLTREYVNLPIFNLPDFQSKYVAIWVGEDFLESPGLFRGTLNMIFALGSLATDPSNQNEASIYFIRGQNLIGLGGLDGEDVGHVQAYLIASQYLLAADNAMAAWRSVGLAIRLAQSLRLHLSSGSEHLHRREERELARRVWHGCMIMERIIAMNQGLSTVTSHPLRAPLPTPLENEYIDVLFGGEPAAGTDRPSIIEFFTASARLYDRFEEIAAIQDELRLTGSCSVQKKLENFDAQILLNVDRLLCNWKAGLPPFLQPGSEHLALSSPIALRQHNITRIRYLHMRLLLWRPFLTMMAFSPDSSPPASENSGQRHRQHSIDSPLTFTIARDGAIKCILSAREIIDILARYQLSDEKAGHIGPVPSWWENVGYVYACAMVFLAACKCPASLRRETPSTHFVKEGWQLSIRLLEGYRSFSSTASKCLRALNSLVVVVAAAGDGNTMVNGTSTPQDMTWLESLPADLED